MIVSLHGWGANAQDLASLAPIFQLTDYQFMFPNAPFAHPRVLQGKMWYDFEHDNGLLQQSQQMLTEWLNSLESTTGVPLSRTFLSGFSQGGAMTLDVGLNLPLAGLIVLSGYLHPISAATKAVFPPVLIVHGRQDSIVPLKAAQAAKDTLLNLGVAVEYHEFNMGHEIRPEVVELIRKFVRTIANK